MLRWIEQKLDQYMPTIAVWSIWIGILLLALSAGFSTHSWLFGHSQVSAIGTVAENVATVAADGKTVYATHVRFRLPSGELVTFVDPTLSSENDDPDYATATDVPVLYPRGNPKAAIIATIRRAYFAAIVFGFLGVIVFDLGLIFRFILKRKIPESTTIR
jgi:hypothetical protein